MSPVVDIFGRLPDLFGCLVGLLYGFLYTRFGLPSFVITLAGLLGFLGLQLWVLGDTGTIGLGFDSWIVVVPLCRLELKVSRGKPGLSSEPGKIDCAVPGP